MARIAGVNIPDNKRVAISLTYIYGIGRSLADTILNDLKINPDQRVKDMPESELNAVRDRIEKDARVEGDLRRVISQDIKILKEINSFRGSRHKNNLPVRGQRTKTNARAKRGKRVTMGSGRTKLQKT
ncbi:30S ribosomal protein S13 [Candidatus Microgenomates bacterium]|nr:30S ribosomal protein S13 [Candidatus Microgenomates bacterium]